MPVVSRPPFQSTEAVPQPAVIAAEEFPTRLFLVRHGRSADVVPGTREASDPPLAGEGVLQAERLAKRLADTPIAAVYSSHLRRAVDTARHLATPHGLDVTEREDLQEVLLGQWSEGEFRRRAMVRDPEWLEFSRSGRWDKVPGSEGDDSLRHRVRTAVDEIAEAHPGGTVVVVAHGGVINAYLADLLELHRSFFITVENTSVTLVRARPGSTGGEGRVVVTVNDCHHLYDPILDVPAIA